MQPSDPSDLPARLRLLAFPNRPETALAAAGGRRSPRFQRDPWRLELVSDSGCCRRRKPANKWRIKTECVGQLFGLTLLSADRCRPAVGLGGRWSSDGMPL